ncbi:Radical SAM domain protein [uncultured Desulfobacterium sp.]|uniref:Radical SAM domain protein n=1 Tax=uncultured Desulfobacterium sp. TaxID=201089 RepID=A0A445MR02_9BACT|nr:Radical SAM domain protein [uncultured Desulfobacterium sp.]
MRYIFLPLKFESIMKILLIYPYCLEPRLHVEEVSVPPIGIYYVGAMLRENHYDVEILNWYDVHKAPQLIRKTLMKKRPDIIGFSILHANRWGAIEISGIAKELNPEVKIIFGGIGATFLWELLLTNFKAVDFVVIGEGERTFLSLVRFLEAGGREGLNDIKGIAFRQGSAVLRTEEAGFIPELDDLPNPARYFEYQHVASTRGCPGKCTFCGSPSFWGNSVRFHSPGYFVEQLELLYKKGITFFFFSDDTFTIKKEHVIEICKGIIEKGLNITWVAISRVNYVNEEALFWMRKAGCTQISYGVESGSDKIRNGVFNKNIKKDQIKTAFDLTISYGILPRVYFIYGSPGETWATIDETLDLIRDIKPLSAIFYILDLFPGTALYSDFLKRTGNTDQIWLNKIEDILYFETDPELDQQQILEFGKKLRDGFHRRLAEFAGSIELNNIKELIPFHADFLSRLGMTFSHGDYAGVEAIKEKIKIAEQLFKSSLNYQLNHRAYLGLGMIKQQDRKSDQATQILMEGVKYFPESEQLNLCLAINYMNTGEFKKALDCLLKFRHSPEAIPYIARCYEALGEREKFSGV